MKYRTRDGDMIDQICATHYGTEAGHAERVYAANPGLAELGPVLPSGVVVTLPDAAPSPVPPARLRLWD